MIEKISGQIENLNPATVTLDTHGGVGYLLNITLPTFTSLEGRHDAVLLVHEVIREDAWTLYGFLEEAERALFRALLGVSGVGAGSARMILSSISYTELPAVIASGNSRRLKDVKGIGSKTAERIIVDLKDKIKVDENVLPDIGAQLPPAFDEALEALVVLGFQRAASQKALRKIFSDNPSARLEAAIKKAMSML